MKITRSKPHERKIYDAVKTWLQRKPRSQDKMHVSDLLYPRKTYWQKLHPQPMTDDQAGYFVAGHAHHGVIEAVLGPKKEDNRSDAGEFETDGIYFSPDLRMPYPIEIKTSRAMYEPKEPLEGYSGYLKQLGAYQALMGHEKGGLLVFYLTLKDGYKRKPAFRFYKVEMSKAELKKKRTELKKRAFVLTEAIKQRNWRTLELCPIWLCRDCVYFKQCKPWIEDSSRKKLQKEAA